MKDKQVIKKIVLQLGSKEVSLTPDEAKKLFEALGEMFEKKVVHVYEPYRWYWGSVYTVPYTSTTTTAASAGTSAGYTDWTANNGTTFTLTNNSLACSLS